MFIGSVNVEDVGKAGNPKSSIIRHFNHEFIIPFVGLGFLQEFEGELALSGTSKAIQHEDTLTFGIRVEIFMHTLEDFLSSRK